MSTAGAKEHGISLRALVVLLTYAAVICGYPIFGDQDIPGGVFVVGWLGTSFVAGMLVPQRWMLSVPALVLVVLMAVMMAGASDSELLSDALSGVALFVLMLGEMAGIRLGIAAHRRLRV